MKCLASQVLITSRLVKKNFLTIVLFQFLFNLSLLVHRWCVYVLSFLICSVQHAVAIARCSDSSDMPPLCCEIARLCNVCFGCAIVCGECVDSVVHAISLSYSKVFVALLVYTF